MQIDIDQLIKQIEGKKELIQALAKVKRDNSLFLKDDTRERGKSYLASDKMLASVQKPFTDHGVHIQHMASDYQHTEAAYQFLKGDKYVKDSKVACLFTATHLETGQTIVYAHSMAAVADNSTSMNDAISGAVTRCLGIFIKGLVLVPKLSRSELGSTKDTVNAQHQIARANQEITAKLQSQNSREAG